MSSTPEQNIVGAATAALLGVTEGFTIDAVTGRSFDGHGWLVGGVIPSLVLRDTMSAGELIRLVTIWYGGAEAISKWTGGNVLIGGWGHGGSLFLDVVTVLHDEEKAIMLGKLWDQLAIGRLDGDEYRELALV